MPWQDIATFPCSDNLNRLWGNNRSINLDSLISVLLVFRISLFLFVSLVRSERFTVLLFSSIFKNSFLFFSPNILWRGLFISPSFSLTLCLSVCLPFSHTYSLPFSFLFSFLSLFIFLSFSRYMFSVLILFFNQLLYFYFYFFFLNRFRFSIFSFFFSCYNFFLSRFFLFCK